MQPTWASQQQVEAGYAGGQGQYFGQPSETFTYGAAPMKDGHAMMKPRRRVNLPALFGCLFGPWLMFTVLFGFMSFKVRYNSPGVKNFVIILCVAVIAGVGWMAYRAFRQRYNPNVSVGAGYRQIVSWYIFAVIMLIASFILAIIFGDLNFWYNLQPYYDIMNLQIYPGIDPAKTQGNQLMDAGQITFASGTTLDLQKSMGFKNLDWYCVAPIVSPNITTYDFWAVGINCCSGLSTDFMCGEFNNPSARSGLRLMRDDQRPFFRLTVQQAEAAYAIKAPHPLFFYWMQDVNTEMNTYRDDGYKYYLLGVFTYFAFNLFCCVCALLLLSKTGAM